MHTHLRISELVLDRTVDVLAEAGNTALKTTWSALRVALYIIIQEWHRIPLTPNFVQILNIKLHFLRVGFY